MRRTTPDLSGSRQSVYRVVSIGILVVTIAYVLWTNYVIFVGGNLPLTSIDLGDGSTGAGLTMLFIGDFVAVLAVWFLVDGVLLNLVHMVLSAGGGRRTGPGQRTQPARAGQPGPAPHEQGQYQQGHYQPNQYPQPQYQGPQQWQPQQPQQWQSEPVQQQWQPQQWQSPADRPGRSSADNSNGDSAQATLIAPQNGWSAPRER